MDSVTKNLVTGEVTEPTPLKISKLYKSAISMMAGVSEEVPRLAFERDPTKAYSSEVYVAKERLLTDRVLKKLALKNSLVGTILQTRYTQIMPFGRKRPGRSEIGFDIQLKESVSRKIARYPSDQRQALLDEYEKRINAITKRILTCGDPAAAKDRLTFSNYIGLLARQGMTFGRIATEIVTKPTFTDPNCFSYFRPIDAGTIYKARPLSDAAQSIREKAMEELARIKVCPIDPSKLLNDEYSWIQVLEDGTPKQAFTHQECVVQDFFPSLDYELEGYPVTPMDLAISEIVSHIHLTDYNRLYFESGRSAKGMLLIESDEMDEKQVDKIRQAFQAMITSNQNAHRLPVFGVDKDEKVTYQPMETGGKDAEFQYLSDMTARIIFSAFMMGPDEITGWAYLSKGSANQSLAESNNAYNLQAARDMGLRPILAHIEDYLNAYILPLFDREIADDIVIKLCGLDAETPEKESIRIQQDQNLHCYYDEVLKKVDKPVIGKRWGGEYPFNPYWRQVADQMIPVGAQMEYFLGVEGAASDPRYDYLRDPLYFQQAQLLIQKQQLDMQMQQMQQMQQPQAQGADSGGGGAGNTTDRSGPPMSEAQQANGGGDPQNVPKNPEPNISTKGFDTKLEEAQNGGDLQSNLDQALGELTKSERKVLQKLLKKFS